MRTTKRTAEMKDCEDIYSWRIDDVSREASLNNSKFSLDVHRSWFSNALNDKNRYLYIYEDKTGNKVGMVRFDIKSEASAEVSINVAPEMRGKGFGVEMLSDSVSGFIREKRVKIVIARIKEKNSVSMKTFKKAGFADIFTYKENDVSENIFVLGRTE